MRLEHQCARATTSGRAVRAAVRAGGSARRRAPGARADRGRRARTTLDHEQGAIHRREFDRAREALEEYLAAESWKNPVGIANGHGNLGLVAVYEGDRDEADAHCRQALAYARAPRAGKTIAESLFVMGAVAATDRQAERAIRLYGAADIVNAAMGAARSVPEQFIIDHYLEPAAAQLATEARRQAYDEGAALNLDDAVAYALNEPC